MMIWDFSTNSQFFKKPPFLADNISVIKHFNLWETLSMTVVWHHLRCSEDRISIWAFKIKNLRWSKVIYKISKSQNLKISKSIKFWKWWDFPKNSKFQNRPSPTSRLFCIFLRNFKSLETPLKILVFHQLSTGEIR